jgi:hypothetical protein
MARAARPAREGNTCTTSESCKVTSIMLVPTPLQTLLAGLRMDCSSRITATYNYHTFQVFFVHRKLVNYLLQ